MSVTTQRKAGGRLPSAPRLVALLVFALACVVPAFAQTAPILTLNGSFSLFDFGRQNAGTVSAAKVITVSNSGTATLTISTVTITGTNPGDYMLTATTCGGTSLSPGGTCTATIKFAPVGYGTRTARLTIADNAAGSQHLIPLTGVGLNSAVPNRNVGPIDPRHGFPLWYQDDKGVKLTLCLGSATLCLSTPPNTAQPASVTDALLNFPGEAFWWSAEAEIDLPGGGRARLVLAKEAAFTSEDAAVGKQISFDRVRVRIDDVTP
ncbi:MAG TPA: choice-of-anchor D domain-containing protein, partial [Pyrinomonadaceae bacterium]|nr:choice-of-anchor D domain-containing protein [Pyrinomonadaceae bacterium]